MKTFIQTFVISVLFFAATGFAQNSDSMKVLTDYSLFSEYHKNKDYVSALPYGWSVICLLYTSDAADERSSVDLGGRRIIKKKKTEKYEEYSDMSIRMKITVKNSE